MSWLNPEVDGLVDSSGDPTGEVVTMGGIKAMATQNTVLTVDRSVEWMGVQPYDRTVVTKVVSGPTKRAAILRAEWMDPAGQGNTGGGEGGASRPTSGIVFP